MGNSLKKDIIESAQDRFDEIPKIIQLEALDVEYGWLEVHIGDSDKHTLIEFMLSSLRHVEFQKYRNIDKREFENDVQSGKFVVIDSNVAFKKMEFLRGLFSKFLPNISEELLPVKLDSLERFQTILLIYDEWNNCCLTLVSKCQYKNVYFGNSE